jgi:hypothetical protein
MFWRPLPRAMTEVVDQALPVFSIVNDVLAAITPRHDVVNGAVKFDAKSSWHSRTVVGAVPVCNEKTKNKEGCSLPRYSPRQPR